MTRTADKRRDPMVWLDQWLRSLVPVEIRADGSLRLVPPAPDSCWSQALEQSFQAIRDLGGQSTPTFDAGIPPIGGTMLDAEERHHVVRQN